MYKIGFYLDNMKGNQKYKESKSMLKISKQFLNELRYKSMPKSGLEILR